MTLPRQLLVGITAAFIALLLGIEAIYVTNARHHLEAQLDSHANEAATSLALSIGAQMQSMDVALVNTIVNPVFDRGQFASIEVKAADGSSAFVRRLERADLSLPAWFIRFVAFDSPTGQSLISAGWRQMGKVIVHVHPQYAYQQLWETALATLTWLALLFALALVAMRIHLTGILKPLRMIEDAAVAIGNREFVSIDVAPRARELARVTRAINSLSSKIRDAISQETAHAERLRREAFEDSMTGQLNRRGFDNAVSAALAKSAEVHSGALALFALGGLDEINRALGLTKGNEVLRQFADALAAPAAGVTALVGRWQGPTFAAFIANGTREAATVWADGVCRSVIAALRAAGLSQSVGIYAGFAHFSVGEATLAALSKLAEAALAQAAVRGSGVQSVELEAAGAQHPDMKSEIESAMCGGRVSLLAQKVASIPDDSVMQFEFLAQLVDSRGQAISAGAFVPVASLHGLLPALDRRVVELALAALTRAKTLPGIVSVNVAMQSILDAGFRSGLQRLLADSPREAQRMVFEMTGAAASKSPEITKGFARELAGLGSRLALDNFEMDRYALALVHDLMPAYVKLAPVFTREIGAQDDVRFVLEAMLRVFRPLEIPLIAQGVEDRALVALLAEIGVAGYQGFALGRPEPLAE